MTRHDTTVCASHVYNPFPRFFFRFVLPCESALAQGVTRQALRDWRRDRHHLFAARWEDLCRLAVPWMQGWGALHGPACAWRENGQEQSEVDIVARSVDGKSILVGECKWSDSRKPFDLSAIDRRLRRHAERMPGPRDKTTVTSCWLGGNASTTGQIDELITPRPVMTTLQC